MSAKASLTVVRSRAGSSNVIPKAVRVNASPARIVASWPTTRDAPARRNAIDAADQIRRVAG